MMETLTQNSSLHSCLRERRREVEYCLERYELSKGAGAAIRFTQVMESAEDRSSRIRLALRDLGPVFVAFGIYLSSRNDVLPALDCAELASLPNHGEPMTLGEVEELIGKELHGTIEELFLYFDPTPCESRLMTQSHFALLPDWSSAVVTFVRPHFQLQFEEEFELLLLLKEAFSCAEWPELDLKSEIAAFAHSVRFQTDFIRQAELLETLALDASEFGSLRVPEVHRLLSTCAVLTTGRSFGSKLVDVFRRSEQLQPIEGYGMARQICLVWLRQALFGRAFPLEPRAENILVFPSDQTAFHGSPLCGVTPEARRKLGVYLNAVLAEDPDQACFSLLQQVTCAARKASSEALRNSFRQAVAFRCGEWKSAGRTHGLAEELLLHWKLMRQHQYRLQDHLIAFYRGLFLITECCHQLTSMRDPLREAAEELRVMTVVDQFREMPPIKNWNGELSHYAALMMEMPKRLDQVLTMIGAGSPRRHLNTEETPEPKRRQKAATVMMLLCVLLTAIAFVGSQRSAVPGPERAIALTLLLAFISVLWYRQ